MGSVTHSTFKLHEVWRLQDAHQFRQIHALPSGRYLLAGGLDGPTLPQSRTACSMAVADLQHRELIWKATCPGHKPFDYSCATDAQAIGVIPNRFKSAFSGLMRFDLETGQRLAQDIGATGVQGIAPLSGNSVAYALWADRSLLVLSDGNMITTYELSEDPYFRIAGLTQYDEQHVISTMQRTYLKAGKGIIDYVHQLRSREGQVVWEHASRNESVAVSPGRDLIFPYPNAGLGSDSKVEVLAAKSGSRTQTLTISSSLANLVCLTSNIILFCDSEYRLCVFDLRQGENVARVAFPKECPGWLAIGVSHSQHTIMACKANNFLSPQSTLIAFEYE